MAIQVLDLRTFIPYGHRSHYLELKETVYCGVVEYRSGIHHTDACCEGGNVFVGEIHEFDKPVTINCENQVVLPWLSDVFKKIEL